MSNSIRKPAIAASVLWSMPDCQRIITNYSFTTGWFEFPPSCWQTNEVVFYDTLFPNVDGSNFQMLLPQWADMAQNVWQGCIRHPERLRLRDQSLSEDGPLRFRKADGWGSGWDVKSMRLEAQVFRFGCFGAFILTGKR